MICSENGIKLFSSHGTLKEALIIQDERTRTSNERSPFLYLHNKILQVKNKNASLRSEAQHFSYN